MLPEEKIDDWLLQRVDHWLWEQEAQLPQRNSASAVHVYLEFLVYISEYCEN